MVNSVLAVIEGAFQNPGSRNRWGYCAECLTLDIFTQGETWDELRSDVREAVLTYFYQ